MGADLIVFLAKGPTKFGGNQIKKARKRAEEIIKFAGKVCELLQQSNANGDGSPPLTDEEEKFLEDALRNPLLRGFNSQEQYDNISDCEDKLEEMAAATAKDEVEKFATWWECGGARDTSSRLDPDDKKQQIVVCGDMSWGDSPQGYGYQTFRYAEWYDIPNSLGVR